MVNVYCIFSNFINLHCSTFINNYLCLFVFFLCSNPYSRRPPSRRGDRGSSRGDIKSRLGRVPDGATGSQGYKSDWYKVVVGIKIICVQLQLLIFIILFLPYFGFGDLT